MEAARLGDHPGTVRLALDLSEPLAFRTFTLADPFRVVIDFSRFQWRAGDALVLPPSGLVTALRHGTFAPTTSRVVIDLSRPAVIEKAFLLPPKDGKGPRFVLDLREVSRQAYLALPERAAIASPGAAAASSDPLANIVPSRRPLDSRPMVVIDAGHGGIDPGAESVSGVYEKDLVLRYAKALERSLLDTGLFRVALTRRDDRFIPLRGRIAIAQRAGGALFVSIHANSHDSDRIRGAAVYTLSERASDKEAARSAASENAVDSLAGLDLNEQNGEVIDILRDLARRETMNLSKRFAETLVSQVGSVTPLLKNTHRSAGFAVLKSASVPSILFEIGYLSHPKEERLLRQKDHQRKLVDAMVKAIRSYFDWHESVTRL